MNHTHQLTSTSYPTVLWLPSKPEKRGEQLFDADSVLDAYNEGVQKGFGQEISKIEQGLNQLQNLHMERVAIYVRSIVDFLAMQELKVRDAYLRVLQWDEMNVIILVEEDSFLKPEFDEVYDITDRFEDELAASESSLGLTFSFMPYNESFDIHCLHADGFTLKLTKATGNETAHATATQNQ